MSEVRHPLFARFYSRVVVRQMEKLGAGPYRDRLLAGLSGTVVEVGAGEGANLHRYPPEVTRVLAVEPEDYLRARAVAAAGATTVPVEVVDAVATAVPLGDGAADAVVCSLVLCSVDDVPAALAEARRVLRPGGELRFLEHVEAHEPGPMRRLQKALDATVWPRLLGGCHCGRDTAGAIERAGFQIVEIERFSFPEGARGPTTPAIVGRAVAA